jgi:hypothetical protein
MTLRILWFIIAASLLGAHFYRAGNDVLLALCLLTPLLFLLRRPWSLLVLQAAAYGATLTWLMTALELVQYRQQLGRPWTAAVVILAVVALFTLMAGLLLNSASMRNGYSTAARPGSGSGTLHE